MGKFKGYGRPVRNSPSLLGRKSTPTPKFLVRLEHILSATSARFFRILYLCLHWIIYSATSFLEKCRKVVLEKWFGKLRFFFLVNHFFRTRKKVDLCYKTTFFLVNPFSRARFLQPDFSNHISRTRFLRTAKIEGAE